MQVVQKPLLYSLDISVFCKVLDFPFTFSRVELFSAYKVAVLFLNCTLPVVVCMLGHSSID